MPSWEQILRELAKTQEAEGAPAYDAVRRKYLAELYAHTGRNVILYATGWLQKQAEDPRLVTINDEDIQGIMTVIHGLSGKALDLILHSPGGSVEATEALVKYLRSKFTEIRVIVPQLAMSAATMLACAADAIVMGKHSSLGPIDPQITLPTPLGQRMVPAQAVLDQFDRAQRECQDPAKLGSWMLMLGQYGPDLLVQCEHAIDLSKCLVEEWLATYMFRADPAKASEIAGWLSNHGNFKSHGRHIDRAEAENRGLRIERLEGDQDLQDLVLSAYHATSHTFSGTPAVKIIENQRGKAFIKLFAPPPRVLFSQGPPASTTESPGQEEQSSP